MWDMGHGGSGKVVGSVQCPPVRPRIGDNSRFVPAVPCAPVCASLVWERLAELKDQDRIFLLFYRES